MDFENVLPGGEIAGLYSILTTAEALKLVARALWYIENHAEDVTAAPAPERRAWDRPGSRAVLAAGLSPRAAGRRMTAREAAAALGEIAMLLEVVGGNPFRAKAFQSAARTAGDVVRRPHGARRRGRAAHPSAAWARGSPAC